MKEHPYGQYYFGPTGMTPDEIVEVSALSLSHILQRRRIYYLDIGDNYAPSLARFLPTESGVVNGKSVLFFWYPYDQDRDFVLDFSRPDSRGSVVLSFGKEARATDIVVTILFPFVFVRAPGRFYQCTVTDISHTVRERCLSALQQLKTVSEHLDYFVFVAVGKAFGVTQQSWWLTLIQKVEPYLKSGADLSKLLMDYGLVFYEDELGRVQYPILESHNESGDEDYEEAPPDPQVAQDLLAAVGLAPASIGSAGVKSGE
jgi:hypothetical protein